MANEERISRSLLFFIAIFFASLGSNFGNVYCRHKTRKIYFPLGMDYLFWKQAYLLVSLPIIYEPRLEIDAVIIWL